MKKIVSLILIVLLTASNILAKGIFIRPGTKANSMGGAYTAIAHDASAIFWNPAGLSDVDDSGAEVSAFYINADAKSNASLNNFPVPDAAAGDFPLPGIYLLIDEPLAYDSKKLNTTATLPFAGAYKRLNDTCVLGFGFFATGGGGGKWEDSITTPLGKDTIDALVDATYGYMVGNVSVGRKLSETLSIGIGLNILYMTDKVKISKEYTKSATSILPFTGYEMSYETDASGTGFEGVVGGLYKPMDNLRLGFNVKTGSTIKLKGTETNEISGLSVLGMPDMIIASDYTQNYAYPMTYSIGAAYDPAEKLTTSIAAHINNYSSMKTDIDYATDLPGTFDDVNQKLDWKNTVDISVGTEYRLNEKLQLRAGVLRDALPQSNDKLTLLNTNQYILTSISLGLGYTIGDVQIDLGFTNTLSDKPTLNGVEYEYPSNSFRVSTGYKF